MQGTVAGPKRKRSLFGKEEKTRRGVRIVLVPSQENKARKTSVTGRD